MQFPFPTTSIGDCMALIINGEVSMKPYRRLPVNEQKEYWTAHRLSYSLNNQTIPVKPPNQREGFVLHTCHNKWCVNPRHLKIGTCRQNSLEAHQQNPDWRQRQSAAIKGIKHTAEHNAKIGLASVGRKHSAESKAKISAAITGIKRSAETCAKISAAKRTQRA